MRRCVTISMMPTPHGSIKGLRPPPYGNARPCSSPCGAADAGRHLHPGRHRRPAKSPQGHVQAAQPGPGRRLARLEKATDAAAPTIDKAAEAAPVEVPRATSEWLDETLVKIDAGVKVVAGTMLALGKFPRLASTALAASIIPTTLAGHRFWEETDPQAKQAQQIHFFKNVGLLGGLLIAAADTEGKPSLGWRGRRAAEAAATSIGDAGSRVSELAGGVGESVTGPR